MRTATTTRAPIPGLARIADATGDRQFAIALARGLELLRAFGPADRALTNRELCDRTGLPKATVSRMTHTLTLLGYLSAMLMWTGWAAYAFKFNEISLHLPMADVEGSRRPMNLLFIQGSVGICVAVLAYFVLDKDTKCNAFRWLQRVLRLDLGKPEPARERNFGRVTFLETLTVLWFCYGVSLFLGDPRYLGYHHPATYAVVGALALWGCYLVWRLVHFTRVMAGIRYAIPTKAIFWIPFGEFFPRYGFYEEFWLQPWNYGPQIAGVLVLFVALGALAVLVPQRRSAQGREG